MRLPLRWKGNRSFQKALHSSANDDALTFLSSLKACDIVAPQSHRAPDHAVSDQDRETANLLQSEISMICQEVLSTAKRQSLDQMKPIPPGRVYMSPCELAEAGDSQFLEESQSSAESTKTELASGCSCVVSLVGTVCSVPTLCSENNNAYAEFTVEFNCPNPYSSTVVSCIRCFGECLQHYATNSVRVGDMVHILGHLIPPSGEQYTVGVFPQGGNLSVVFPKSDAS